jgi:hypothetical protein
MDNLEDFFKKRLNRFDEPVEEWAKPDSNDWDMIASNVPMFNKTPFWKTANSRLIGLSVILISALLYIAYLKTEVTALEKRTTIQNEKIVEIEKYIKTIDEKSIEKQSIIKAENLLLKEQNEIAVQENKQLKTILKQEKEVGIKFYKKQDRTNVFYEKDEMGGNLLDSNRLFIPKKQLSNHQIAQPLAENYSYSNHTNRIEEEGIVLNNDRIQNELRPLETISINNKIDNDYLKRPLLVLSQPIIENKKQRKKLNIRLPNISIDNIKLGYEYRLQSLNTASVLSIKELETPKVDNFKSNYIGLHGLTLDIPLHKNWSIQAGARLSVSPLMFLTYGESTYDTENEYILPDGTVIKNINIEQETPFLKTNTEVQLLFDLDNKLENNESLKWITEGNQRQKTFQVPLGVNYQLGQKKWNLLLGAGLQWNMVKLEEELDYELTVYNEKEEFRVLMSNSEVLSASKNLDYFSTYISAGIEYQLRDNWSLQAAATYNYYINKPTNDLWKGSDKAISIGLKYHF